MFFGLRILAFIAVLGAAALVGCGGGGGSPVASFVVTPPPGAPAAYLAYPPSGAYAATTELSAIVVGERGLNASYAVVLSPNPYPSVPSFSLNLGPSPLPSPLATAPPAASGSFAYVSALLQGQISNGITVDVVLHPITTYAVSLVGCQTPNANGSCTFTQSIPVGSFQTDCGLPPPVPNPFEQLGGPTNGATGVATTIGTIAVNGSFPFTAFTGGSASLTLTAANGTTVAVGPYTALPTPAVAGPGITQIQNAVGGTIPTLAAATTYTVAITYPSFANSPPSCLAPYSMKLGSFTTQ
jgi:hypothetical protein